MIRITLILLLGMATTAQAGHEFEGRDLSVGAALYADHCAACHGADLEGAPNWQTPDENGMYPAPPHDETGHTWHHDNQLLFDYVKQGGAASLAARGVTGFNSGMEGFEDILSDDDIWDVLAFIRSTWPRRVQEIQAGRNPPHE